ncbi:hypothetical protein QO034_22860 [Sedimentitalea sp. JM2-8]|uniref:GIY-YIG domain-containing protein n=1 Tax=Sedimentitalea xiamensis TaxID=3050037 RepID=A0ABT7FLF6_9RHOB|nr:hypothetical protein [Sedimentitalea xiamensis]MDK3075898.1 hypothetical protein [Sedimentitalea xiamensis]
MTPHEALATLHALPLQRLVGIPTEKGIYALADHEHRFRYIGSTEGRDFRDRIQNRHVTGSESNSHKFSWAYNVGRMFRGPKSRDPEIMADRQAAKDLRTAFIRKHCRAVWMPLTGTRPEIEALEHAMVAIAPPETVQWNRERFHVAPPAEPAALVDGLIAELGLQLSTRARLERQARRHRLSLGEKV